MDGAALNVANTKLANNVSTFISSFVGALGINQKTSSQEARNLGQRLAAPINWLLGGRVNTPRLQRGLSHDFKLNKPKIENPFADNKFTDALFLPGTQGAVLDESYTELVADRLNSMKEDKGALLKVADSLAKQLKERGTFNAAHPDSKVGLVNIVTNPGRDLGLNTANYGQTSLYFDPDKLAQAQIKQKPGDEAVDFAIEPGKLTKKNILVAMIYSMFDYAVENNRTEDLLVALNRMIAMQGAQADKIH